MNYKIIQFRRKFNSVCQGLQDLQDIQGSTTGVGVTKHTSVLFVWQTPIDSARPCQTLVNTYNFSQIIDRLLKVGYRLLCIFIHLVNKSYLEYVEVLNYFMIQNRHSLDLTQLHITKMLEKNSCLNKFDRVFVDMSESIVFVSYPHPHVGNENIEESFPQA